MTTSVHAARARLHSAVVVVAIAARLDSERRAEEGDVVLDERDLARVALGRPPVVLFRRARDEDDEGGRKTMRRVNSYPSADHELYIPLLMNFSIY